MSSLILNSNLNSNPNSNPKVNLPDRYTNIDRFIEYNIDTTIAKSLDEINVLAFYTNDPYTDSWLGYILANWCGRLMLLQFELEPKAWMIDTFSIKVLNTRNSLIRALEIEEWSVFNGNLRDMIIEIIKLWEMLETGEF